MPRKPSLRFHRHGEIQRIRGQLERDGFPRLQMALLVTLTGASGFIVSYALLHAGWVVMWSRYLAAFGAAYLVFLGLLWLWLRTRADDWVDAPDVLDMVPSRSSGSGGFGSGRGGDFGGGGASASFEAPSGSVSTVGDSGGPVGDALGTAAEAEELAIPLVVLVLAVAVVCSSFFMVYSAPALFAELLVDGVLSASLYRRLRGLETRHWLATALRRTVWPFVLTAAVVSACGWGMALYAPGAQSIGDVIAQARSGA